MTSSTMPRRSLLTTGFSILLRHWPALVWTYFANLGLAVLFSLPLHFQIAAITANSLASQPLTNGFDLSVLGEVSHKLSEGAGSAASASHFSIPIYLLLYFILIPGTLFSYQADTPSTLSALVYGGFEFVWRFVRIALYTLLLFALILGPLLAIRNAFDTHIDDTLVGRHAFHIELAVLLVILLIAAFLRLYMDLVEVYTIQLGTHLRPATAARPARPDKRVYRTFLPALRTLGRNFFRAYIVWVLLAVLGFLAIYVTAHTAMHTLARPHVWPMFLLAQVGLFLSLATRFYQRAAETVLVLDNPIPMPVILQPVAEVPELLVVEQAVILETAPTEPIATEPISTEPIPTEPEAAEPQDPA